MDVESNGRKLCPHCGTHEIELLRVCHNSSCSAYATEESIYKGWESPPSAPDSGSEKPHVIPTGEQLYTMVTSRFKSGAFPWGMVAESGKAAWSAAAADLLLSPDTILARHSQGGVREDESAAKILGLLREARATLETWKDVVPAVSLCSDIDKVLAAKA